MVDVSNYPTHKQTYEPIATQTLYSAASSVTFSNIPQTFKDLVVTGSGSTDATDRAIKCQLNGDTLTNYSHTNVLGYSGGAISQRSSSATFWYIANNWTTSQSFLIGHIMSYSNSSVYKTTISEESNATVATNVVGLWRSTSSITSLTLFPVTGNFNTGSTFSLYGIAG